MRFVFVFIAAVATLMGYLAFRPDCPGGTVVADRATCVAAFDAAFCARAMEGADSLARRSGQSFSTQSQCLEQWPVCLERADIPAWGPRPSGYCLVRAVDGGVERIEPRYARR